MTWRLPLQVLRVRLRPSGDVRLPALPTTSVHGGLGDALASLVCIRDRGRPCTGCPHADACAYPTIFEPRPDGQLAGLGVTTRGPTVLVVSPERAVTVAQPHHLTPRDPLDLRVVLIGASAIAQGSLVIAALRKMAELGLGLDRDAKGRGKFALESFEQSTPLHAPAPPVTAACRLRFTTPVRLVSDGQVVAAPDAAVLWTSIVRRLDVLGRYVGVGPMPRIADQGAPFLLENPQFQTLAIGRHSSRQHARMTWPGFVGTVDVGGLTPEAWSALWWASWVQLGKGTSFGFGRFEVEGT